MRSPWLSRSRGISATNTAKRATQSDPKLNTTAKGRTQVRFVAAPHATSAAATGSRTMRGAHPPGDSCALSMSKAIHWPHRLGTMSAEITKSTAMVTPRIASDRHSRRAGNHRYTTAGVSFVRSKNDQADGHRSPATRAARNQDVQVARRQLECDWVERHDSPIAQLRHIHQSAAMLIASQPSWTISHGTSWISAKTNAQRGRIPKGDRCIEVAHRAYVWVVEVEVPVAPKVVPSLLVVQDQKREDEDAGNRQPRLDWGDPTVQWQGSQPPWNPQGIATRQPSAVHPIVRSRRALPGSRHKSEQSDRSGVGPSGRCHAAPRC